MAWPAFIIVVVVAVFFLRSLSQNNQLDCELFYPTEICWFSLLGWRWVGWRFGLELTVSGILGSWGKQFVLLAWLYYNFSKFVFFCFYLYCLLASKLCYRLCSSLSPVFPAATLVLPVVAAVQWTICRITAAAVLPRLHSPTANRQSAWLIVFGRKLKVLE